MGLKPKSKGHANFYECCDLTKKVYLMLYTIRYNIYYLVLYTNMCVKGPFFDDQKLFRVQYKYFYLQNNKMLK